MGEPSEREGAWRPEQADLEAIRRVLADRSVQRRIQQAIDGFSKSDREPGVTAEELPRYLRDLGS